MKRHGRTLRRDGESTSSRAWRGLAARISVRSILPIAVLAAALSAATSTPARADDPVARSLVLPLDGSAVDLAPFAQAPGGKVRFVLTGAVFSRVDGSSYDAFTRRVGDRVVQEDGAFVVLPPGARLLESDPLAHRYVVEVDARASAPVAFATSKLVGRYLLPRSEVVERLDGAIAVHVLGAAPPVATGLAAMPTTAPELRDEDALGSFFALVALPLPLLLLLRRTPEERQKLRRIARALRAIEVEARRLGPAFLPVVDAARRVSDAAATLGHDAARARSAFRRTSWVQSGAALERRRKVQDREQEVVQRLGYLADQLEVLATELVAVDIDDGSSRALTDRLSDLVHELDEAVAARHEAETEAGAA